MTQCRQEGRQPRHSMGFRYEVVSKIKTLAQRQADAERWAAPVLPGSVADLAARLRRGLEGSKGLHLTFSHDNFVKHVGGVQFCLKRESQEVQAEGRVHLHLYPTNPWPTVRAGTSATPLGVIFNGDTLGDFLATDIQTVLDNLALPIARSFAVHSMLGHSSRDVIDTVRSAGMNAGFFWAHDFTSVCAGVHLLRNDIENCRAPPPGSSACQICVYSAGRATHVDQHQRLFASLDLTLVTPSQAALATLKAGTDLDVRAERVLPHVVLKPATDVPPAPRVGPFRLAFPGGALVHKGWPIFRELALRFAPDPRYEFFHLSTEPQPGLPITHHKVSVSAVQPFAMRDAMVDLRIDAALIWSLCQETFSFATFEAWAAGAAIVTGPDSGNVAAVVLEGAPGRVLSDDQALVADFASGKILELSRAVRRPALQDLAFSRMTADLLEPL